MGVPSNGGLGPWQIAVIASLSLYGVDKLHATAFATGVFAVQSIWVIICGLFGIAMLALKKRLADRLKSVLTVGADVKLMEPNSIQRSEGKSKRVIDKRNIE